VNYGVREKLLSELDRRAEAGNLPQLCAEMLWNYQDGRPKLWTTMQAMRLRRDRRELFHGGSYVPLHAQGNKREHVIAFAREHGGHVAVTVVPRLSCALAQGTMQMPLGLLWENTELPVTSKTPEFLENVFTGEKIKVSPRRTLLCSEIFAHFPVALLVSG
jgi:(1->4)-alpha-D-glucan 1-alpha-D-glucosylmutase